MSSSFTISRRPGLTAPPAMVLQNMDVDVGLPPKMSGGAFGREERADRPARYARRRTVWSRASSEPPRRGTTSCAPPRTRWTSAASSSHGRPAARTTLIAEHYRSASATSSWTRIQDTNHAIRPRARASSGTAKDGVQARRADSCRRLRPVDFAFRERHDPATSRFERDFTGARTISRAELPLHAEHSVVRTRERHRPQYRTPREEPVDRSNAALLFPGHRRFRNTKQQAPPSSADRRLADSGVSGHRGLLPHRRLNPRWRNSSYARSIPYRVVSSYAT